MLADSETPPLMAGESQSSSLTKVTSHSLLLLLIGMYQLKYNILIESNAQVYIQPVSLLLGKIPNVIKIIYNTKLKKTNLLKSHHITWKKLIDYTFLDLKVVEVIILTLVKYSYTCQM